MQIRKYAPLAIGALLLITLVFIPSSRNMKWPRAAEQTLHKPVLPVQGQVIDHVSAELFVNVSLNDEEFEQLKQMNEEFMEYTEGFTVHLSNTSVHEHMYEQWMEEHTLGNPVDIILLDNSWVRPFAVSGYLKPVDYVMAGDVFSDQLPAVIDAIRWNGYLWGVPRMLNPNVLVWNQELLKEFGFEQPPAKWDELNSVLSLLTADARNVRYAANIKLDDFTQLLTLLGKYEPDNVLDLKAWTDKQVDQTRVLHSLEEHGRMMMASSAEEIEDAFLNNDLLMAVMSWKDYKQFSDKGMNHVIFDAEALSYPWLNGQSFVISSRSKHDKEAMVWIEAMTQTSKQKELYEKFKLLPATSSAIAALSIWDRDAAGRAIDWDARLNEKPADQKSSRIDPWWIMQWGDWKEHWQEDADGMLSAIMQH